MWLTSEHALCRTWHWRVCMDIIPVCLFVVCNQSFSHLLNSHKPAGHCSIEQRCLRTPAVRIRMIDYSMTNQSTILFQLCNNSLVCCLLASIKPLCHDEICISTLSQKYTFTYWPLKSTTSSVYCPEASIGHTTVSPFFTIPYFRHTRKSSSPKPGAWWTMPVPLSAVT